MKNGDISNRGSYTIAFRIEDTIIKKNSNSGFSEFMRNFNRLYDYSIDVGAMSVINRLYRNYDYNIVLVANSNNDNKSAIHSVLKKLPFCDCVYVNPNRVSEIETNLIIEEWEYYVDDNDRRRSKITSSSAVSLKDFLTTCMKVR